MHGRHRPGRLRQRSTRTPLVVAAVVALATATTLVVQNLADAGGCSRGGGVRLSVAADPAIAPPLRRVASDWTGTDEPEINGRCVTVEVTAAPTASVASTLAEDAGGVVSVAEPVAQSPAPQEEVPNVWVPDSSYWITRMQEISRSIFEADPVSLASSPIGLAVSPAGAEVLGDGPLSPDGLAQVLAEELPLTVAEPRRDTAGLVGAVWLQVALAPDEQDLPEAVGLFRSLGEVPTDTGSVLAAFEEGLAAAPVSEQAVIAYNAAQPATTVTVVPVVDAPALDFPYAVLARQHRDVGTAANMFRAALVDASDLLTEHGFRAPDGTAREGFPIGHGVTAEPAPALPVGPPERVSQVLRIWTSSRSDARVLSVVSTNASMLQPIGPLTRIEVFQAAALGGLDLFTDGTDLGHWEYAARLDGDQDWVEGVPIELLTEEHRQRIQEAVLSLQTTGSNESAMFETLLAAYQEMKEGYDRTRSNTLVLWTAGGDTAGELTLDETLRELERLNDLTRPIRVVLLGLGPDANMDQLEAIARATGGGAFQILDPQEINLIFLRALLT